MSNNIAKNDKKTKKIKKVKKGIDLNLTIWYIISAFQKGRRKIFEN